MSDPAAEHVRQICAVRGERGSCSWPHCFIDDHCDIALIIAEDERLDLADEIRRRTKGGST